MNEIPPMSDTDFDDHEPGDVNGNVDPAWAKKQKLQVKQGANPGNRGPRTPRPPRPPRAPRGANPAAAGGVPAVATPTGGVIEQGANLGAVAAQPTHGEASVSIEGAAVPMGAPSDDSGERAHVGERRARGMRRSRRGGKAERPEGFVAPRSDESKDSGSINVPQDESGQAGEEIQNRVQSNSDASPNENFVSGSELADSDGGSPNPGAFGDPNRPMDTSARRNRNRNRNRVRSDEARAIRAARKSAAAEDGAVALDASGEPMADAAGDGERLHKVLAQQGLGSRREMESLIESGEVEVNGERAHVGQVVSERDRVYVKRRKVSIKLGDDNPRILIYHKPSGEIVSRDDPEARDTVFDRLPKPDHGKWIAMGRLDFNTEGLLLFTTYGELANRMMHPRYEIIREYSVRVLGELTPEQEDQLIDGIELDDGPARVLSLDRIDRDSDGANHWYRITINEGRNREVRRMFEFLGLTVSRLIRTRYGVVNMPSWLKRGQYKLLDENDTFNVLEAVGLRSRKKLEKAARFGGARGKLPQGPVGPMRSATEHEAIWNGAPANVGAMPGARADRNGRGRSQRGGAGFGAQPSMQQQQFPGFGGADATSSTLGRRGPNRAKRGRGGEVNGNVDPNFRAGRGPNLRRGRNGAGSAPPEFDEEGNRINVAPIGGSAGAAGGDGRPRQQRNRRGQGRSTPRGGDVNGNVAANANANANSNPNGGPRNGRNRNRRGRGPREAGGVEGAPPQGGASVALAGESSFPTNPNAENRPRGRGRRNQRRGGRGRGPKDAQAGDNSAPSPVSSEADAG